MVTTKYEIMVAFWDIVGKAANLFQLIGGLDAITIVTSCFWKLDEIAEECRKLEERVQMLRVLLLSPTGCWITQHSLELGHLVTNALKDAHDLFEACNGSTLFARVRRGRTMARRFRDLRRSIDGYCGLILSVNAFLLAVAGGQANPPPPPSLLVRNRTELSDDVGVPPLTGDSIDAETSTAAPPEHTHIIDFGQD